MKTPDLLVQPQQQQQLIRPTLFQLRDLVTVSFGAKLPNLHLTCARQSDLARSRTQPHTSFFSSRQNSHNRRDSLLNAVPVKSAIAVIEQALASSDPQTVVLQVN